jgi:hypothetical protein
LFGDGLLLGGGGWFPVAAHYSEGRAQEDRQQRSARHWAKFRAAIGRRNRVVRQRERFSGGKSSLPLKLNFVWLLTQLEIPMLL